MYPEGPSGNCLLQIVSSGSGGFVKLKTNHGTFLGLTRDCSVKAVATGRTGFQVQCEGGKYVFTHESGKFLSVTEGKISCIDNQSVNSKFDVVPGEPKAPDAAPSSKTPAKAAPSKSILKSPVGLEAAASEIIRPGLDLPAPELAVVEEKTKVIIDSTVAAVDIKSTIVPQALFLSPCKTPEPSAKENQAVITTVPLATVRSRPKIAEKPAGATNAELPLAFSL